MSTIAVPRFKVEVLDDKGGKPVKVRITNEGPQEITRAEAIEELKELQRLLAMMSPEEETKFWTMMQRIIRLGAKSGTMKIT